MSESSIALVAKTLGDGISIAVGSNHYIASYQFPDLFIQTSGGSTPRFRVSRYYWDLNPRVVVDVVKDLKFGEMEVAVKKKYFADRGIYYIWVKDEWDGEGAEYQLNKLQPNAAQKLRDSAGPLMGPRKRK